MVHVFGPQARFPYMRDRKYDVPDAPLEDLWRLLDFLGFDRAVLVQASVHGVDNKAMIDALARGGGRLRGVALIDETFSEDDIAQMNAAGVRGVRFNFVRLLGGPPPLSVFEHVVETIRPFGWHIALHVGGEELIEYGTLFERADVPVVIEHMGRVDISGGLEQRSFRWMIDLAKTSGFWIKIDMGDRLSLQGPPYDDMVPFARAIVEAIPDRTIWGTDWPHPMYQAGKIMPDDGDLVDLLGRYVPDAELRHRILVQNPQALYGFPEMRQADV
ncbi:MAG: amidohydrolase [Pseudorhodoplanes sp.]|uniref:amidohydrolase family protein n=1 Tax=Pseudorhodoplanes sp. TaxID=1934341 RepID=UPI003D0DE00C